MKPYPRYKTIGLPWLDKIPAHWNVFRNKNFLHERKSLVGDNASSYTLLSLTLNGVIPRDMENPTGKFPSDFSTYKAVEPGDMVFCLFDMDETPRTVGLSNLTGMVTGAYDVFSVSGANSRFLYYYYLSIDNTKSLKPYYSGLRKVVPPSRFLGIPMPLPPPSEQDRIVRYLDEKTAAIDDLVRAKEREIGLLRERKQAMVSTAVTGGAAGRGWEGRGGQEGGGTRGREREGFRDSGNPWMGKVPAGWKVAKTGHLFHMVLGKMLANVPSSPADTFERYACAKDVHFSGIDTSDLKEMWFSPEEKAICQTRHGDLLIVEGGAGAGGAALVEDDGGYCIQNSIHLLRAKHLLGWTPFLKYWVYSLVSRGYIDHICNKATIPHFTKDKVFNMPLPVPPLPEQRRIVAHLDAICSQIDAAETVIRKQIALLQEFRTRLVSDAVTGAVEV
jgi:type I restriction enzyme S subunit